MKLVKSASMKRFILEVSARMLLVLVVGALSSAQIARPDDSVTSAKEADVFGLPIAGELQTQQASVSGSEQKTLVHQPSGYISGTVLDQSGAASAGAEVLLSGEDQTSSQRINAGGNGQFQLRHQALQRGSSRRFCGPVKPTWFLRLFWW